MAAANDNQGLKIAVASFVALSVALAVTSYLSYSSYSTYYAKWDEEQKSKRDADTKRDDAVRNFREARELLGFSKAESSKDIQDASKKSTTQWQNKLSALREDVSKIVTEAQAKGATAEDVKRFREMADQLFDEINKDPNATYTSWVDHLVDLVRAQAQLTVAFAGDNIDLRTQLNSVNQANAKSLAEQEALAQKAQAELKAEHEKYEKDRQEAVTKLDTYQTQIQTLTAENSTLKTQLERTKEESAKRYAQLLGVSREQREKLAKNENVLEVRDGLVTYVDYTRMEVRTNISRRMGARPQLQFAIFDAHAPGLPTDKPKGRIELIVVNDNGSVAKILSQTSTSNPIKAGDQVYSAPWNPHEQMHYALVGKIDVNRDGRDDRRMLKRLIERAGGVIDYDLPPASEGDETGSMTAATNWVIYDDRKPAGGTIKDPSPTKEDSDFQRRRAEVIRSAREQGIPPMTIGRLLSSLGYPNGMLLPKDMREGAGLERINRGNAATLEPPPTIKPSTDKADDTSKDDDSAKSGDDKPAKDDAADKEDKGADKDKADSGDEPK